MPLRRQQRRSSPSGTMPRPTRNSSIRRSRKSRAGKLLLLVGPTALGDALKRLGCYIIVRMAAKIAEADYAAQPFLFVDHRQSAHLRLAHLARDVVHIIVV